jgi:hypothetical protein
MSRLYMYGVVDATKPLTFEVQGLAGNLQVIVEGGIGAIVGTAPECDLILLPREDTMRYLLQHQEVLEAAMMHTTVLPVKFAALAPHEDAVRCVLIEGRDVFAAQLKEFTDHLQIEVVVQWRFEQVLAELATTKDIAELRERADASGGEDESKRFDQALKAALERRRALLNEEICGVLGTVATDMAAGTPKNDCEAANVSLLLNKTDMGSLEGMLNRLDAEMAGEVDFRATGPQPLSNFATIEVIFPSAETAHPDWLVEASSAANQVMINIIRQQLQPPLYGVDVQEGIA